MSTPSDTPIIVPEIIGNALIHATAFDTRDALVLDAARVQTVVTIEDAQLAGDSLKSLKLFLAKVESARTTVKAPVLELGKSIDNLAKELTTAATEQYNRLNRLLGTFQQAQQRLADEASDKARKEEQRILDEAADKQRQIEASGVRVENRTEKLEDKTFNQIAEIRAVAIAATAPAVSGISLRQEPEFEILDIHALYKARPDLVKLEVDRAAMKSFLKKFPKAELAGVKHWLAAKTSVRG